MTDSTTDTTDVVDTPPVWPGPLSTVPAGTVIPEGSAVEALDLARALLADVLAYRERVRPVLDQGARLPSQAYEDAADLRRSVAIVADTLARRGMLGAAILAQQAARHAERIAGLVAAVGDAKGDDLADLFGPALSRCRAQAAASDEEFARALVAVTDAGVITADAVLAALAAGGLDVAEQQQRDTIARLAGQGKTPSVIGGLLGLSPERVVEIAQAADVTMVADAAERAPATAFVPGLVDMLRLMNTPPAALLDFDEVSPAQAADWSRELWDLLVPLVAIRVAADKRGRQRA